MTALALLLVLAAPPIARATELEGAFAVEPARVSIGEPTTWTLVVEHSPGRVELGAAPFVDDRSWVVLEGPVVSSERAGDLEHTRFRWTVLSLEAGPRDPGPVEVRLAGGDPVEVGGATLEVAPELGSDEDAPRPLTGFHDVAERVGPLAPWQLALLAALLVAAAVAWRRLRRRTPAPAPPPDVLERLAALEHDAAAAEGERARSLAYELSAVVRCGVDRALGVDHAGQTDEEWLDAIGGEERVAAIAADLRTLLGACAEVKYGGRVPTRFALEELLARARHVLDAVRAKGGRRAA